MSFIRVLRPRLEFGGGSGGGGDGTTTTTVEPPSAAQPYLSQGYGASADLFNQGGPLQYPGATTVPFSPLTETGLGMTESIAGTPSPILQAGSEGIVNTLQGKYGFNPNMPAPTTNPYLDAMFGNAADSTMSRLKGEFSAGGRNLDAAMPARSEELQTLAASIYGQGWEAERGRQYGAEEGKANRVLSALPMVGDVYGAQFMPADRMLAAGSAVEGQAGRLQADAEGRWNTEQARPENALDAFLNRIRGSTGSYGTTSSTIDDGSKYNVSGAAGGALSGLALSSLLGGSGPPGWMLAALGGLGGLYG